MNNTTKYPATIREAGDMAHKLDLDLSEFLEMLGPIPMPPEGYTLAHGSSDRWIGNDIVKRRWIITPVWTWNSAGGSHTIELWTARKSVGETDAPLSPADALQLAADLTAAAQTVLGAGGNN